MKVKTFIAIYLWTITTQITVETRVLKKRQIYREQVLPHAGGKIPESAFNADRLALNRLQREGIAIPDGILLEQRMHQVFPYSHRAQRPTFKVALTPSGRYTPPEGRYHYHDNEIPSIDTTYLIPQINKHRIQYGPKLPIKPIYKSLRLPNPELKGHLKYRPQPIIHDHRFPYSYSGGYQIHDSSLRHPPPPHHSPPSVSTSSYSVSHYPSLDNNQFASLTPYGWSPFQEDYVASSLFNDFEQFFNDLQKRSSDDAISNESKIHQQAIVSPTTTTVDGSSRHQNVPK